MQEGKLPDNAESVPHVITFDMVQLSISKDANIALWKFMKILIKTIATSPNHQKIQQQHVHEIQSGKGICSNL